VNKCCKFGYCMISTFSCVHVLWLNHMSVCFSFLHVRASIAIVHISYGNSVPVVSVITRPEKIQTSGFHHMIA